jgi:hypothetical protein
MVYVDSETDVGLPLALGHDTVGHSTPLPLLPLLPLPLPLPGDNTDAATTTTRCAASLISNMVTTSIAERALGLGLGLGQRDDDKRDIRVQRMGRNQGDAGVRF